MKISCVSIMAFLFNRSHCCHSKFLRRISLSRTSVCSVGQLSYRACAEVSALSHSEFLFLRPSAILFCIATHWSISLRISPHQSVSFSKLRRLSVYFCIMCHQILLNYGDVPTEYTPQNILTDCYIFLFLFHKTGKALI